MITLYLLPLLLLSVIPAYIAQTKGKSFGAWYVYGLFLLPITFVHSLILGRDDRKCPHCAELVKLEAIVCKHCGNALEVTTALEAMPLTQEEIDIERSKTKKETSTILMPLIFFVGASIILLLFCIITGVGIVPLIIPRVPMLSEAPNKPHLEALVASHNIL